MQRLEQGLGSDLSLRLALGKLRNRLHGDLAGCGMVLRINDRIQNPTHPQLVRGSPEQAGGEDGTGGCEGHQVV